ncbi:hypothetical protein AVEN_12725-1 [Araneus ventricosus]|uniref:Uncharacterized protein n=1 Tax=Araneus ventricosus TaxID=182803 RepID=A0A4Y2ABL3_ARAVE|nr:hypothetical protein AVEN_12725-1 [Araneus ventricosus]
MSRKKQLSRSKTYEIWSKWIRSGGIQKNSKSKTPSADSNLGPRCEASGRTKDLPTLAPCIEARNETLNPPCRGGGMKVTVELYEPHNFEPWLDGDDDTGAFWRRHKPSPNFHTTLVE